MSSMQYTSFPRKMETFNLSDIFGSKVDYLELSDYTKNVLSTPQHLLKSDEDAVNACALGLYDIGKDVTFYGCFKNPFVYDLCIHLPDNYYGKEQGEIAQRYEDIIDAGGGFDHEAMDQEMEEYWDKKHSLHNKVLHRFLEKHLRIGEFIEIYTTWAEPVNMGFQPPTKEQAIDLKDLINMPRQKSVGQKERHKLTIHKTC